MSMKQVNVLIVIDTDSVKKAYPSPSQSSSTPTGISHSNAWMICHSPRGIVSGQGTADLNFNAHVRDEVSFMATSIYGNSDDAVIVYDLKYWKGDRVFNQWRPDLFTLSGAVTPDPSTTNGLPAVSGSGNFSSLDTTIKKAGTEHFYVQFALYQLGDKGEKQKLFGYYYWDPTCTVP